MEAQSICVLCFTFIHLQFILHDSCQSSSLGQNRKFLCKSSLLQYSSDGEVTCHLRPICLQGAGWQLLRDTSQTKCSRHHFFKMCVLSWEGKNKKSFLFIMEISPGISCYKLPSATGKPKRWGKMGAPPTLF